MAQQVDTRSASGPTGGEIERVTDKATNAVVTITSTPRKFFSAAFGHAGAAVTFTTYYKSGVDSAFDAILDQKTNATDYAFVPNTEIPLGQGDYVVVDATDPGAGNESALTLITHD